MYMGTRWQLSWWCHVVGPHNVMDDVMVMSCMMLWWCGNLYIYFCPLVLVDINLFWCLSLSILWSSNGGFVQVLSKRKGRFLLDKNVSHLQPIQGWPQAVHCHLWRIPTQRCCQYRHVRVRIFCCGTAVLFLTSRTEPWHSFMGKKCTFHPSSTVSASSFCRSAFL